MPIRARYYPAYNEVGIHTSTSFVFVNLEDWDAMVRGVNSQVAPPAPPKPSFTFWLGADAE